MDPTRNLDQSSEQKRSNKMLNGTQTIYSKNKDKSIRYHLVVPAVFLNHGSTDPVETLENKVEDEVANTTSVKSYTQPVDQISGSEPELLFSEAVEYFSSKYPKENPILKILTRTTVGENQALKEEARPGKEIDESAEVEKMALRFSKQFGVDKATALSIAKNAVEAAKLAKAS
jgi:hypothetical protein